MHTLKNWRAKRAGGRITVYGQDATSGADRKVVGVDVIEPRNGLVVATDKNGDEYVLTA